ncbi:MAG: Lrp/AsnC family transcriptional regulator [Fulvivirga sp.]|uniref:Lrp/AsnC family transcriptional regulator n=1 Tax=Fulvivirga sp. TaxID=1931237 RepID=UPI0032EE0CE5
MDSLDRKLVSILQRNGKMPMKELSSELGLSITPVYDRLKRLEKQGVITGYHAHIDEKKMGFGLEVFCSVTLESHKADFLKQFEEDIKKFEEVLECYHLAGSFDFLLKILVKNMDDYGGFVNKKLARLDNIGVVNSHMVLKKIKQTRVLPLTE